MVSSLGPSWFLEADVVFDLIFFIITGVVSWMGFRAYRFFKDDRHRQFALGFFFICSSYLLLTLTNLLIMLEVRRLTNLEYTWHDIIAIANLTFIGSLMHAALFLVGLTTLLFLYLQITEKKVKLLVFILVGFVILHSYSTRITIYAVTTIFLLFTLVQLAENYRRKRKRSSLLVMLGFGGVFLGECLLLALFLGPIFYVAAGVTMLIGYLLILTSLVRR